MSQQSDIEQLKRQVADLALRQEEMARFISEHSPQFAAVMWMDLDEAIDPPMEGQAVTGKPVMWNGTKWVPMAESITATTICKNQTAKIGDRVKVIRNGENRWIVDNVCIQDTEGETATCGQFIGGVGPAEIIAEVAGVGNNTCGDCVNVNGVYTLGSSLGTWP